MALVRVRPTRAEVLVAKPGGVLLEPAGEEVEWSPYWQRILRDGDIVIAPPDEGDGGPPAATN